MNFGYYTLQFIAQIFLHPLTYNSREVRSQPLSKYVRNWEVRGEASKTLTTAYKGTEVVTPHVYVRT